jgi:hypothetical protein
LNDDDEYFFEDVVEFIKARLWNIKLQSVKVAPLFIPKSTKRLLVVSMNRLV